MCKILVQTPLWISNMLLIDYILLFCLLKIQTIYTFLNTTLLMETVVLRVKEGGVELCTLEKWYNMIKMNSSPADSNMKKPAGEGTCGVTRGLELQQHYRATDYWQECITCQQNKTMHFFFLGPVMISTCDNNTVLCAPQKKYPGFPNKLIKTRVSSQTVAPSSRAVFIFETLTLSPRYLQLWSDGLISMPQNRSLIRVFTRGLVTAVNGKRISVSKWKIK